MEEKSDKNTKIISKYKKLFHHLHVEFPELTELSSKTLETFNVTQRRKSAVLGAFRERIEKVKKKREYSSPHQDPAQTESVHFLQEAAIKCPIIKMTRFQKKDIKNCIGVPKLQLKYGDKMEEMLGEIQREYSEITHAVSVRQKIKGSTQTPGYFEILPFKHVGRTENYKNFVCRRKELKKLWMLNQPLLKSIVNEFFTLPDVLVQIDRNVIDFEDLEYEMQRNLVEAARIIQDFYWKIEVMVQTNMPNLQSSLLNNFLGCCTCAVSIQLSQMIKNTLNYIVNLTTPNKIPLLNINVTFKNKMEIFPTSEQTSQLFQCLIKDVLALTKPLRALRNRKVDKNFPKPLSIYLTKEFINDNLKTVQRNITTIYKPFSDHLESLNEEFKVVYKDINGDSTISDLEFAKGCDKIKHFSYYYDKVSLVPRCELFDNGVLVQSHYVKEIQRRLSEQKNRYFEALASQSHWEINDIYESFDIIKTRAGIEPQTTEQTIEIGKYMTWVKSEFIQEATERIGENLLLLATLLQLGEFEDHHLDLNVKVVKELGRIEPLVLENLAQYEQSKFEAEEKLQKQIETVNDLTRAVHPILCLLDDMDDISNIRQYLGKINQHLLKIKHISTQIDWINTEEVSLSFPKSTYPEFEELKNYVYPFFHLMKLSLDVQRNISVWLDGQLDLQSYEKTKVKIRSYQEELTEMYKTYRKKLRQAQDENLQMRFKGTVDDPDALNWPAPLKICSKTTKLIEDFQPCLSLMKIVCNQSLKIRHWKEMSTVANIDLSPNAGSTLRKLLTYNLEPFLGPLEIISQGASHEQELLEIVLKMKKTWLDVKLIGEVYKDDLIVFSNLNEVVKFIEENMEKLLILNRSAFAKPHKDVIENFSNDMANLKDILIFYEKLQEKFYHLLPFFTFIIENEETLEQTEEFDKVKEFKTNLYSTLKTDNVFDILKKEGLLKDIQGYYNLFETIYSGVRQYLNKIRTKFPRFYFLSNEELIEILSNIMLDEKIIQKYVKRSIEGISELMIQNKNIVGIKSRYNEEIYLEKQVTINRKLVNVFVETEKALHNKMIQEVLTTSKSDLNDEKVISNCLGQVLFVGLEIFCTFLTHRVINGDKNGLKDIRSLVENYTQWITTKKERNVKTNILKSTVISLIQHEEFLTKIQEDEIKENDFVWLTKLKYYLENDTCIVRLLNLSLIYGYEFYGDFSVGILTPYNERCNISLICAYSSNNYGAIHGEACSGKTETFKNLAVALGVHYKVIPCADFVTFKTLQRLLLGCSKGNMWLCLDEMNKIEFSDLSLMSDLLRDFNRLKIVEDERKLRSFVCVTLSPTFPKLSDLPMTFKSQFRSICMLPVEFFRLSELTLISSGYKSAKYLSKCVDCLLKTLSNVLTENSNKFSLKLLKKILRNLDGNFDLPLEKERDIFVETLGRNIKPMLSLDDSNIFEEIIQRIFEISTVNETEQLPLRTKIVSHLENHNLHPEKSYVDRILQVEEALTSKQNVICVGDIFSGKTKAINALYNLKTEGKGSLDIVNPTIFDTKELYGFMDYKYDLWKEGILTKIFRKFSTLNDSWLIFDGPIQSYWIETLYSILDERRVFTIGSGDFLRIEDSNSILFEVAELNGASPSLISRCSVVFFETSPQPWLTLVKPWIRKMYNNWPDNVQNLLEDLTFWMIPPLMKFIEQHCSGVYQMGQFYLVKRTVDYLQILLNEALARKDEDMKNVIIWVQASVLLGIYIGLTGTLTDESSVKFDVYFKQLSKNQVPEYPLPESIEKLDVNVPTEGLFSEYFYIYKGRGTFKYTPDTLKNEKVMFKTYIDDVMVPTTDTQRTQTILDKHISNHFPVILTGPTGTAKTLCIKHFVNHVLDKSKYTTIFLKFIPRLTSRRLQNGIQSSFLKNISFDSQKEVKKNLIVIEDLNVVTLNEHKVSTVVEFMRQTLDYKFWYDTGNFEKIPMENLGFVATMGPQGGLYRGVCKRLLKNFDIFRINDVCDENITRIFSNILQVEWRKNGFAADIALVTNSLANATLSVYEFCSNNFKTSPLKFSYSYNVWDFLKVLRGLFSLKKESADSNKKIFNKLWLNECAKVFGDRLLNVQERNKLYEEMMIIYELQFKECFSETFNGIKYQEIPDKIIFGTITSERYEEMDYENLKETLEDFSRKYPLNTGLKLVLFQEVYPKIITISRLLSIENSHGLLLGVSGTGRKTLIDLASIIHNSKVFNPHTSYLYDEKTWHKTFKNVLLHAGGEGKTSSMYLNEEHLNHPFILEDVNSFLKNGEIMDLFEIEEEPMVLNMVRLDAQCGNPNLNISSHDVYTFFLERCRKKLHFFLSFNCEPTMIETRSHTYQSLVKYCTPVWFDQWSDEALFDIAEKWTETCEIPSDIQSYVPETFVKFFNDSKSASGSFKINFVTTKTYVEFLRLYVDIVEREKCSLREIKEKNLTGLRKLKYADNQIKKLQEHLCAYQLQLRIMSKKAGDMTRQIARETLDVERASDLVKKDEKVANVQAEAAAILKADCEIDLAQAIPILEDAIQALNTLKPPDITLVKSMKNPPDAIKLVMAAVCVIKDVKPDRIPDPSTGRKLIDYWGPSKRILGDMNFLQSLKDFDKDHIKPEIMVKIRKDYLSHKDFKPHVVAKASSAAEGLCKWIIAMDMYDKVAKEVAPKKEKLEKAEREYAETLAILDEKKLEVVRLEKQLAQLNLKLQEANKKQSRLQKTADACNRKLERSVILVDGFEDEKVKWSEEVAKLDLKHRCLSGDVLLTGAFIAYLSPFPTQFRRNMVEKWYRHLKNCNVPVSEDWDLTTTLISNNFPLWGLPQEKYFIENSIVHKYSQKYSLIIDPHGLAKIWIRKTVDKASLHITKYGYTNFIPDVKLSLESGKTLLVENVDENISSCLNTILNKELTKKGNKYSIEFEGEHITYNKNFKLIILTTLTCPNYKTEITNKVRIIDFTITDFSIKTKLLSLVIKTEYPLVSKQISISKKKQKKNENLLKEYEENILKTLSAAETDLLEDNRTLRLLDETKTMYKRINQEIYLPDKVVPTFQRLEKNYTEFSHFASTIFFCVEDFLRDIKNKQFSYKQFLTVFRKSILDAPLSKDPLKRLENIKSCFTYTISRHIGRLVFPKQYLNFLCHLSCQILMFNGKIFQEEIQFLSKMQCMRQNSIPKEILDDFNRKTVKTGKWDRMKYLQNFKPFEGFLDSVKDNQTIWDNYLSETDPENQQIPHPWHDKLNDFQKFLLLQTLRPDRTKDCIKKLVTQVLDEKYVNTVRIDLEKLYSESFCLSPILFLTTNSISPITKIRNFAVEKKFDNKFQSVCLSEGDNKTAEEIIRMGQSEGLWVCLLNCHLSNTWRYNLEKICELMTFENTHENFRLCLISEVSFDLPPDLLEKCVKTVYEETESFKDNLLNSYKDFVDDVNLQEYQNYSQKTVRLLYRMVCFHTVLNWRSKFEGLAWNNPFTLEDYNLRFALKFIPNIISTYETNEALDYLIGQAFYCGQFNNQVDYKVVDSFFKEFLSLEETSIFTFPKKNNIHDFIEHIVDRIPSRETPECFGFNQACLIRKNIQESLGFSLYSPTIGQTLDDYYNHEELKKIIETSYELINVEIECETEIEKQHNMLESVLKREIKHCLQLRNHIMKYLKILDVILRNNTLFSTELKEIVHDLLTNKIPKIFLKYSFVTDLSYSSFMINLRQRLLFFKEWRENGAPESFWISAFFFPSAILTVEKILYAQELGKNLNTFSNIFQITDCEGFKIHGLFLVNARFVIATSYIELLPENVYFNEIPPIFIKPLLKSDEVCYNCPVYRTDGRRDSKRFRNLIFFVGLESHISKDALAQLGVALVCEKPKEFQSK